MKTTLTTTRGFNLYFVNTFQVRQLVFFSEDGKEYPVNWFGSNNEYPELELPFEVSRKLKIDYSSKTAFYTKDRNPILPSDKTVELFIPLSKVNHTIETGVVYRTTETETTYCDKLSVTLNASKYEYVPKNDGTKEFHWTKTPIKERILSEKMNPSWVKSDFGKRLKKLSDVAKSVNVDLSKYDLEKLHKVFKITVKRQKD